MIAEIDEMEFEFRGGRAQEDFTCTSCERECALGDDWLEVHMSDRMCGPLCLDCWHKVPKLFERIAQQPGLYVDMKAITEQIEARYKAAKARDN